MRTLAAEVNSVCAEVNSGLQNTLARFEDEQRANEKRFNRLESSKADKVDVEALKEAVEVVQDAVGSMIPVTTGPEEPTEVNSTRDFVGNQLEMLGEKRSLGLTVLRDRFDEAMYKYYPPYGTSDSPRYAQAHLLECWETPGWGLMGSKHLVGAERLKDAVEQWHALKGGNARSNGKRKGGNPFFSRRVSPPRMYRPLGKHY
jgi:hypothetical protein